MNIQDFISINNVGFKNPKDYFIDLANYNFYVYGNQKRLLIKQYKQDIITQYMKVMLLV